MTEAELQDYLHTHIPLSADMGVTVGAIDPNGVTLGAPLDPNINVHGSVFGGSASSIAMLAAWSCLHLKMEAAGVPATLVIHQSSVSFARPILGAFTVEATVKNPADWPDFVSMFEKKGKARITITAKALYDGQTAATLDGEFVAIRAKEKAGA